MDKFKMEKESWVCKTKKNQLTSHLLDDAVILVSNLFCYHSTSGFKITLVQVVTQVVCYITTDYSSILLML